LTSIFSVAKHPSSNMKLIYGHLLFLEVEGLRGLVLHKSVTVGGVLLDILEVQYERIKNSSLCRKPNDPQPLYPQCDFTPPGASFLPCSTDRRCSCSFQLCPILALPQFGGSISDLRSLTTEANICIARIGKRDTMQSANSQEAGNCHHD
jgi:hypothetical protein